MFKSEVSARVLRGTLGVLVALCGLMLGLGASAAPAELPTVLAARVSTTPERGRLVIDLSKATEFATVSLEDPLRIAVDVKASAVTTIAPQEVNGSGIVTGFSTHMVGDDRARTELVLSKPAVVQQAYVLSPIADQPARLVVDLILTSDDDFKARAAVDLANSGQTQVADAASSSSSEASSSVAPGSSEAVSSEAVSSEAVSSEAAISSSDLPRVESSSEAPPSSSSEAVAQTPEPPPLPNGSRPLVVLDPGHGGVDNGASAPSGVHEKDITLAFALQLRDALVKSGHFDVALTRDDDTYLTLNERVDLARQNRADLFISLHADTFQQSDIRGASIYTLNERATDILDKVLADGENRSDIVSTYVTPDAKPQLVDLLVDLMRRQARQQAYLAAEDIVKSMQPDLALRRFPVRQADFFVLQAPDVPSMLVELGFLSNNADIANLENAKWRDKMVAAISAGLDAYFAELRGNPQ